MLASDINIIQEISELPLNTEATSTLYAVYLKEFAQLVNLPIIYPSKEFFTDENIYSFVFFTNTFRKAILAAVGSALLYHGLPGIFSSSGDYPSTVKMYKVIYNLYLLLQL